MNNLKKMMIAAISMLLCISMVACGNNAKEDTAATTTEGASTTASATEATASATEATTEAPVEEKAAIIAPTVDANTLGEQLWNAFVAAKEEKPEITAEEMANLLITNEVIQFMGGAMPLEANQEFFTGFGEFKITGYDSGALYMPMIGSIPFIGYIFELPAGADVDAFIKNLNDNADPRWNICVTADQTVVGAYETTVFFLMCPASLAA